MVGNRNKFNSEGRVPVNRTQNQRFSGEEENRWQHAHSMQIVAVIAALLHDIGKATVGFQNKLTASHGQAKGDPYRHEWISLRLFQAMIRDCNSDEEWLNRLIDFDGFMQTNPTWLERWADAPEKACIDSLPPLAQLIAWLIVTHHRLPTYGLKYYKQDIRQKQQSSPRSWGREHGEPFNIEALYSQLKPYDQWVRNSNIDNSPLFWQLKEVVMRSMRWQKELKRWARKARDHHPLNKLAASAISDPLFMHLSRLYLMLADHNYSSLDASDVRRVQGDEELANKLAANTDKNHKLKQALDEHLLGVGKFTKLVAQEIPQLPYKLRQMHGLPKGYEPFLARTNSPNYLWQNGAFDLAKKLQPVTQSQGFFGVNMASTGRGKTLANARIMYALTAPAMGARFTIALGLRVLTLQTGVALRERLSLNEDDLAILVGGAANRKLFELAQDETESSYEQSGSESQETLLDHSDSVEGSLLPDEFGTLLADPKARKLITSPVVSCTIDHIIQASECSRGGRYIAPVLRLLTSDLVLDEPDDFDQSDLPALSRLVHLAGLYGSKLLLSSATLTPDMVTGLYQAYAAGRAIWNSHMGLDLNLPVTVTCAWFDEYSQSSQECTDAAQFMQQHQSFVAKRVAKLAQEAPQRKAEVLPCELPSPEENARVNMAAFAKVVADGAVRLHHDHAQICEKTGKTASIGLIRMANVGPIIQLVKNLYQLEVPQNTQFHLCCYHAKQLLVLRNVLEQKLDRILKRGEPDGFIWQPEVRQALCDSDAEHHLFIVVASPVAEVGRDHDYDWAIVEPSSMRSLIQVAGRVGRHRPNRIAQTPNLLVLDKNIRALKGDTPCFTRPGFEQERKFSLASHSAGQLLTKAQLERVDSVARVQRPDNLDSRNNLADLEHAVMEDLLNRPDNFLAAYWQPNNGNRASAHLQGISPFRYNSVRQQDYVCLPVPEDPDGYRFALAESAWEDLENCTYQTGQIGFGEFGCSNSYASPWLTSELGEELLLLAQQLGEDDIARVARQYTAVRLEQYNSKWYFHPWFGFWQKS